MQIADTNTYSAANFHCRLTAATENDEKPTTINRIQMKSCMIFRFASIRIAHLIPSYPICNQNAEQ